MTCKEETGHRTWSRILPPRRTRGDRRIPGRRSWSRCLTSFWVAPGSCAVACRPPAAWPWPCASGERKVSDGHPYRAATRTVPASRSLRTGGRLAWSSARCASGGRCVTCLSRTTEGMVARRRAKSMGKSLSAVMMTRPSAVACLRIPSSSAATRPTWSTCTTSCPARVKGATRGGRQVRVQQQPHAGRAMGTSRSLTTAAAYSRAASTSSRSR